MSRGLGKIERAIFEAIEAKGTYLDTFNLVIKAYALEPNVDGIIHISEAQYASVRRACNSLKRKGMIKPMGRLYRGGVAWALPSYRHPSIP